MMLALALLAAALPLPALTGRVVDDADLIAPAREGLLTWALAETERTMRHQLVVVTLPSLNGMTIEDMGMKLGNGWGIGRKGYDDGVLLIVAPRERKVRIAVGRGLESTLTDAEAGTIIQEQIVPRLRQGRMEAGILRGTASIIREISDR